VGRRGPAPLPAGVKLARGETRPSRVNYLAPQPRDSRPPLPQGMDAVARKVWLHVEREMAASGVIASADADVLRCYCEAVSRCMPGPPSRLYGSGVPWTGNVICGTRRRAIASPATTAVVARANAITAVRSRCMGSIFAPAVGASSMPAVAAQRSTVAQRAAPDVRLGPVRWRELLDVLESHALGK
jgi:hypothetical protein